jgi:hypothetical protein
MLSQTLQSPAGFGEVIDVGDELEARARGSAKGRNSVLERAKAVTSLRATPASPDELGSALVVVNR